MTNSFDSENFNSSQSDIMNLIDGAESKIEEVTSEVKKQLAVSSNINESQEARLEAFEDIFQSQVGDTAMIRARNVERELGLKQIYLKFEGGNPTGTQKDRIAFGQTYDALRRGYDALTVATCGNYGVAIALATSMAGLKCIIFIPDSYHTVRINEMIGLGADVRKYKGDYEGAVEHSRDFASKNEIYDANPGGENINLQLTSYGEIAYEIYDDLRDAPLVVAAPVSNGTTLAGIYKGFLSLYRRGKTSRMPKIVGGSSYKKNPIVTAFLKGYTHCQDLKPESIKETAVNEPLINWHSIDGDMVLNAIKKTNGWAGNATDKKMLYFSKYLRDKEGLNVVPASTAGLVALLDKNLEEQMPMDRYVVILTGRK